jgi:hypothetical protein
VNVCVLHALASQTLLAMAHQLLDGSAAVVCASRLINNSRERYLFNFNGILTPEAKQDEVGLQDSAHHKHDAQLAVRLLQLHSCRACAAHARDT